MKTQDQQKKKTSVRPMLVSYRGMVMTYAAWREMKRDEGGRK